MTVAPRIFIAQHRDMRYEDAINMLKWGTGDAVRHGTEVLKAVRYRVSAHESNELRGETVVFLSDEIEEYCLFLGQLDLTMWKELGK